MTKANSGQVRGWLLAGLIAPALAGCATSGAEMAESPVEQSWVSSRSAQATASCMALTLQGTPSLVEESEGHWVLIRPNGYGVPIVRWDFIDRPDGGADVHLRTTFGVGVGRGKLGECL